MKSFNLVSAQMMGKRLIPAKETWSGLAARKVLQPGWLCHDKQ
jgi:hypothetical protein